MGMKFPRFAFVVYLADFQENIEDDPIRLSVLYLLYFF